MKYWAHGMTNITSESSEVRNFYDRFYKRCGLRIYLVASKCSRNHFLSEKYKTLQSVKLHPFKIIPLCNYTLQPKTVKVLEPFVEAILWNPFPLFQRILNDVSRITKATSLRCWFNSREQVKAGGDVSGESGGCSNVVTFFFSKKSLTKTGRWAGALSWRRNHLLVVLFFWAFPSDRIPEVTKDVNTRFLIQSSNSFKLYQRISGIFWRCCA